MAKFKYVGPLAGEVIDALDADIAQGETLDVDESHAELIVGLDASPNWERVDHKNAPKVTEGNDGDRA